MEEIGLVFVFLTIPSLRWSWWFRLRPSTLRQAQGPQVRAQDKLRNHRFDKLPACADKRDCPSTPPFDPSTSSGTEGASSGQAQESKKCLLIINKL